MGNSGLTAGEKKPVHIDMRMNNHAGIYQLEELPKPKLANSSIAPYVEVTASINDATGADLGVVYSL